MNDELSPGYNHPESIQFQCNRLDVYLTINQSLRDSPQTFRSLSPDIKDFLYNDGSVEISETVLKTYACRDNAPICFICCIKPDIKSLCSIKIYGFSGKYCREDSTGRDYFFLEGGVKLACRGTPFEIRIINAGKVKRQGKGTLGIRFLEEEVIPLLNEILKRNGHDEPIGYIFGISAELSPDTNALARAKFYSKNGFLITNSHFYKYYQK